MKVSELIEELKKFDGEGKVIYWGWEDEKMALVEVNRVGEYEGGVFLD